jgi:hypothetical protein
VPPRNGVAKPWANCSSACAAIVSPWQLSVSSGVVYPSVARSLTRAGWRPESIDRWRYRGSLWSWRRGRPRPASTGSCSRRWKVEMWRTRLQCGKQPEYRLTAPVVVPARCSSPCRRSWRSCGIASSGRSGSFAQSLRIDHAAGASLPGLGAGRPGTRSPRRPLPADLRHKPNIRRVARCARDPAADPRRRHSD